MLPSRFEHERPSYLRVVRGPAETPIDKLRAGVRDAEYLDMIHFLQEPVQRIALVNYPHLGRNIPRGASLWVPETLLLSDGTPLGREDLINGAFQQWPDHKRGTIPIWENGIHTKTVLTLSERGEAWARIERDLRQHPHRSNVFITPSDESELERMRIVALSHGLNQFFRQRNGMEKIGYPEYRVWRQPK